MPFWGDTDTETGVTISGATVSWGANQVLTAPFSTSTARRTPLPESATSSSRLALRLCSMNARPIGARKRAPRP